MSSGSNGSGSSGTFGNHLVEPVALGKAPEWSARGGFHRAAFPAGARS